jgi:hypothetical protein
VAIRKVHPETAAIARKHAREQLGAQGVKLRSATPAETLKSHAKTGFDSEAVIDTVVARDKKGNEWLLQVELDPTLSKHLNVESGILTFAGMIPVIGAPVVAAFALKDIAKAGIPALTAKLSGNATDPRDRAMLRMGLKHLGLSGLSLATHGMGNAAHAAKGAHGAATAAKGAHVAHTAHSAAKAAHFAHNAHRAVQVAEVAVASKDTIEGVDKGGVGPMARSVLAGLQGIAGIKHGHDDGHGDGHVDARVVVLEHRPASETSV